MNRRGILAGILAFLAAPLAAFGFTPKTHGDVASESPGTWIPECYRRVGRQRKERIRLRELRKGDLFFVRRHEGLCEAIANEDAAYADGDYGVEATWIAPGYPLEQQPTA